ncbi:alpha/beta hydrolase [Marivirga salinae]|uniref:Alpha/beta hydrolase n=1 Tax=Marivirga salinarum TaxID=3059078 RepID=A0AA49GB81_9BACT|nr:alpha/beta hydrolase [Marivirga sp. BDSF4-3]WKK74198.2 alpha/beta hydrolase [Marivirga sp. BDSF4-3]
MSDKKEEMHAVQKYGNGDQVIIMLPGGPGLSYHYLEPLAKDLAELGFQTWLFEPAGYPNHDPGFLPDSIVHYGLELSQLLEEYHLSSPILFGQSFGGSIVFEFLAKHPNYDGKVILSNTFPSAAFLKRGIQDRFESFPQTVQNNYLQAKEQGDLAGIGEIVMSEWIPQHLCRLSELPQPLLITLGESSKVTLQSHFIGPDIFSIQGVFTDWEVVSHLPNIMANILCISGANDYLNKAINLEWMEKLPHAQISIVPESSHLPFFENNSYYMKSLKEFVLK